MSRRTCPGEHAWNDTETYIRFDYRYSKRRAQVVMQNATLVSLGA